MSRRSQRPESSSSAGGLGEDKMDSAGGKSACQVREERSLRTEVMTILVGFEYTTGSGKKCCVRHCLRDPYN